MVTGAVSTVICVLLLIILFYWKKTEDACHQKILDQLEEILIRFRENKFNDLLKTENHAELEKLNDQLEAIGHHIQLLKEEAREEKESTKEMVSYISHQLKTPVAGKAVVDSPSPTRIVPRRCAVPKIGYAINRPPAVGGLSVRKG